MANRITDHFSKNFSVDFVSNTMKNTACQFHQTYELCFFSAGHRTYMINDEEYDIAPNTVIVIPPYTQHSTCGTTAATRTVVYFTETFLKEYFSLSFAKELLNGFSKPFCALTQPRDGIMSLMENIRNCHFQNQKASTALYLAMLFTTIKNIQELPKKSKDDVTQGIVTRTISYIENHLTSLDSLSEIADALHISLSYLEASFRKNIGISLMQYIIKSKINFAMKQLIDTEDSIAEIAEKCGFNSGTHFSNTFKKHTGISPREYRQYH